MRAKRFMRGDTTKYGKRHKPGQMNQTESAYAEILQARLLTGEVIRWEFESITFKLADGCRYTPDFAVWLSSGEMELVDCKGGGPMDEKSRVKVKCAAEKFPMFQWVIEQRLPRVQGWKREEF